MEIWRAEESFRLERMRKISQVQALFLESRDPSNSLPCNISWLAVLSPSLGRGDSLHFSARLLFVFFRTVNICPVHFYLYYI